MAVIKSLSADDLQKHRNKNTVLNKAVEDFEF